MSADGPDVGTCSTMTVSVRAPVTPSSTMPASPPRTSEPASRYVVPGVVSGVPESAATCWMRPFAQISRPSGHAMASASTRSSATTTIRRRLRRRTGATGATPGRVCPWARPGVCAGGRVPRAVPDGGTDARPAGGTCAGRARGCGGGGGGGVAPRRPVGCCGRPGVPTTTGGRVSPSGRGRRPSGTNDGGVWSGPRVVRRGGTGWAPPPGRARLADGLSRGRSSAISRRPPGGRQA
ncbi:hypothetical protein [Actinotalea fermentans]|uniref:hypothetical protein n=1 Tax=Actinotalea fermentans TaxID=43671 RepID=UPI0021C0568F|nr:hypothetical protein [Actinotalea fermentans]